MKIMMKGKEHPTMTKWMFMIISGLLVLFSLGCADDGNNGDNFRTHLNEYNFAQSPFLVATTDDVVIINLEHPDAMGVLGHDTYLRGIDRIRLYFPEDVSHEFVVEHKEEGDAYFVVLLDEAGREILRVDEGNPIVTEDIIAGIYILEIHHGGGIDGAYTLFVRPGSTCTGGDCPLCDLFGGADLSGADLEGADLTGAVLTEADLTYADLAGADLSGADLEAADLTCADLSGANLSWAWMWSSTLNGANLSNADLTHAFIGGFWADHRDANFSGANLSNAVLHDADLGNANFSGANLTGADITEAYLVGANLTDANLTGAILDQATWTDGSTCASGSTGECIR
jgi:hypothetical protein